MIRVDTRQYVVSHGHLPRQPREIPVSPWAFQIDHDPTPVLLTARGPAELPLSCDYT